MNNVLMELKTLIDNGYNIILININNDIIRQIAESLCKLNKPTKCKIYVFDEHKMLRVNDSFEYIDLAKYNIITDIYCMYEFYDRITVIYESSQYATLLNYIKNGIITVNEAMEILFKG